jgi:hypothetical protein
MHALTQQKSVSHGQGLVDEVNGLNAWYKVTLLPLEEDRSR